MEFIKFDMQDETMKMMLLPVYQVYEAEISEDELTEFYPEDSFEKLLEHFEYYFGAKTTFVCVMDGAYKGFVTFHLDCDQTPGYAKGYEGWGHLSEIYTDKQSRGLGLGKALVKLAEDELKKLDIKGIHLMNLLPENEGFWKSLGYIDTGKYEPEEGGLIFEKHL
ncbi:MAG: GNAT family N-acetyltransferase [Defluviitaleaceae bacterium]|nr:GNAT family N-acetyltransferase [Defluviitaleaceae bacterium]